MTELFTVLRVVVSLAAAFGLLWWLQRHLTKRGVLARRAADVKVTSRTSIGGRAQVVTVEEGGMRYLLGVTEHGITVMNRRPASGGTTLVVGEETDAGFSEALRAAEKDQEQAPASVEAGRLHGSVLSASTWRQARHAVREALTARGK